MVLIVIVGSDGSGKGTQVERLKHAMDVSVYDFPDYNSFFGRMISKYLKGEYGDAIAVSPYLASLLYSEDRRDKRDDIVRDLKSGKVVLCNRYVESNIAHQAVKLEDPEEFIRWVEELEYDIFMMPRPDLTIYLHVPYEFRKKLLMKKGERDYMGNDELDEHEKNEEYQLKVEKMYLWLAERYGWKVINCVKDNELRKIEDIHDELRCHVDGFLRSQH